MTQKYFYFTRSQANNSAIYRIELERAVEIHQEYYLSAKAVLGTLRDPENYAASTANNFFRKLKRNAEVTAVNNRFHVNYDCVYNFSGQAVGEWLDWIEAYKSKLELYPEEQWDNLPDPRHKIVYQEKPKYTTVYTKLANLICDYSHEDDHSTELRFNTATLILDLLEAKYPCRQLTAARRIAQTNTVCAWTNMALEGLPREHYINKVAADMLQIANRYQQYFWAHHWDETLQALDIFDHTLFERVAAKITDEPIAKWNKTTGHRDIVASVNTK